MYDGLRTVSRFARKACKKIFWRPTLFFGRKIVDFPSKKQYRSDRFSPRTSFERSEKQCVTCHEIFRINFVSTLTTQNCLHPW